MATNTRCRIPVDIMRDPLTLRSIAKELVAGKDRRATASAETQELADAIVRMLGEPNSPRTKKASLVTAYYLASSGESAAAKLADAGSVPLLLEILVDSDRSTCEKALGALDVILASERGREEAYGHALAVPVLMKKMFRVSETATRFAVSAVWRLMVSDQCREERRVGLAREALGAGAFQKLLLLLQVGCSEGTKEKASELLRMMNGCRGDGECVESADFRGIKRNFL